MGAAFMAAIAQGIYDESILKEDRCVARYLPKMDEVKVKTLVEGWHKAVNAAIAFGI